MNNPQSAVDHPQTAIRNPQPAHSAYPWPWVLFFFMVAFAFYGLRPLGDPDEGRYAETAREMLVSGDWLTPHLQGHLHMTKPPLTYWLIASGMKAAGVNEWGARAFLALAFFLTILCVVELARTWGRSAAESTAAGVVFATSILPFVSGHMLTTDMFLTLWETLGILALWKVWSGAARVTLWRALFWLAFALAFLTKGPPGWLPLLAALTFCYASKTFEPRARLFPGANPGARTLSAIPWILGFVALSLCWYLVIIIRDPQMLRYFLKDEVLERVASSAHGRNKPFWFYPFVITFGLTPWIFLWPALVRRTRAALAPAQSAPGSFFQRLRALEPIKLFSLLWFIIPLAVFCVAKSKMFFYVVPLFVPLAIWTAHELLRFRPALLPPAPGLKPWVYGAAALWCIAALGFVTFPERPKTTNSHRALARQIGEYCAKNDVHALYAVENPLHSISFYSGALINEVDKDTDEILDYLRSKADAAKPILLTLKKSRLRKLSDKGYQVIADDGEVVALTVLPHPAK